ncbi:MAG: DHH family phosphoesterase, partial [Dolichospermum sp.]|nr:DHH family phosphoesterase [Dolichospermum sp.]
MYVNYPASQFESLSLTTDPHPEEVEIEKELIELPPLTRTSLPSSNGDGGIYLAQRGNSLATQKSEELKKTLLVHRHERQLVILQDFPDPDALSCAWSYQLIAQQYDIKCDIVYAGTLSHQENIALVKLTNLPAQRWTMQTLKNKDLSSYQGFVLIDNQGTTSQLLPAIQQAGIPLIVLVDHHSLQGELKSEFTDVRPYVRATATIFTQYLQAGLLTLDNSISQHVKCATALMHGLRSDTNRLMQAQEED